MVSQPAGALGGSFLSLIIYRTARRLLYRVIGLWRPGWRRAVPLLGVLDRYSDTGTLNVLLYSDPRFEANIRALEAELRRVRRGADFRGFEFPHDFPPGAQDLVNTYVR